MAGNKEFKQILRKGGLKATRARIAILETLRTSRKPMSVQAIFEAIPKNMDRATVYRTVGSLKAKGIIAPIDLRHNHAHYELANLSEHHHLICMECGKIEDVHHCDLDETQSKVLRASKHFAKITQHALEFYGICKQCERGDRLLPWSA